MKNTNLIKSIILVVLGIIVGAVAVYFCLVKQPNLSTDKDMINKSPEIMKDDQSSTAKEIRKDIGIEFAYPRDWEIKTENEYPILSSSVSSKVSGDTTLLFNVGRISNTSYDLVSHSKITFLGKEAYVHTFDLCHAEGEGGKYCYLKVMNVITGPKKVYEVKDNQGNVITQDIKAEGLHITYGLSSGSLSNLKLKEEFEKYKSTFENILSSLKFIN